MCGNDTSDTRAPAFSNISATRVHASIVSWDVPGAWYCLGMPEVMEYLSLHNRYQIEKNLFYWAIAMSDCLPLWPHFQNQASIAVNLYGRFPLYFQMILHTFLANI